MYAKSSQPGRIITVRLNPDEDILLSLRAAVEQEKVQNGIIVGGFGSVKRYHVHVVETTNLPPGDIFFKGEEAYDVLAVTGAVINGRVHAHITLSDTEKALGGHLEEGTHVLTFSVITIAETPDIDMADYDTMGNLKRSN